MNCDTSPNARAWDASRQGGVHEVNEGRRDRFPATLSRGKPAVRHELRDIFAIEFQRDELGSLLAPLPQAAHSLSTSRAPSRCGIRAHAWSLRLAVTERLPLIAGSEPIRARDSKRSWFPMVHTRWSTDGVNAAMPKLRPRRQTEPRFTRWRMLRAPRAASPVPRRKANTCELLHTWRNFFSSSGTPHAAERSKSKGPAKRGGGHWSQRWISPRPRDHERELDQRRRGRLSEAPGLFPALRHAWLYRAAVDAVRGGAETSWQCRGNIDRRDAAAMASGAATRWEAEPGRVVPSLRRVRH